MRPLPSPRVPRAVASATAHASVPLVREYEATTKQSLAQRLLEVSLDMDASGKGKSDVQREAVGIARRIVESPLEQRRGLRPPHQPPPAAATSHAGTRTGLVQCSAEI